jgi:hypothetical protein
LWLRFFIRHGGVSDASMGYFERFITEQLLTNLFLFNPQPDDACLGFDNNVLVQHLSPAIILADILVEIDHMLRVVEYEGALDRLQDE